MCRKYNIKWTVFTSLALSAVINFIIAVSTDFSGIKWLWLANGFLMSMLWPTLIRLFSETLPEKHLGKSSVVMGTTVATGTLIIYSLSSLYAAFDKFKLAFYTAAFVEIVVAIIWFLSYKRVVEMTKLQKNDEVHQKSDDKATFNEKKKIANKLIGTISILCFCFLISSLNSLITSIFPMYMREHINSGRWAGVLNGF